MRSIVVVLEDITKMGGIQKVVSVVFSELSKNVNNKITIISLTKTEDSPFFELHSNVIVTYLFSDGIKVRNNYKMVSKAINKCSVVINADMVVVAGMGFLPLLDMKKYGHKCIAWEHGNYYQGHALGHAWRGRHLADRYARRIVVLTERDREQYLQRMANKEKVVRIGNPIKVSGKTSKTMVSNKILSAGRLSKIKGFDVLLEIASIIKGKSISFEWHIYGKGEEYNRLKRVINEKGLNKHVFIHDRVDHLEDVMKDYGVFALTSRKESFGMVLLEAINEGMPVISFDCKFGPGEIIKNGQNGYLVKEGDKQGFAEKLIEMINDVNSETMANRQDTIIEYDLKKIVEKWDNLINEIG